MKNTPKIGEKEDESWDDGIASTGNVVHQKASIIKARHKMLSKNLQG